jgi:hypothetical protein
VVDAADIEVAAHGADRASIRLLGVRDRDELSLLMLVGLGPTDGDK